MCFLSSGAGVTWSVGSHAAPPLQCSTFEITVGYGTAFGIMCHHALTAIPKYYPRYPLLLNYKRISFLAFHYVRSAECHASFPKKWQHFLQDSVYSV